MSGRVLPLSAQVLPDPEEVKRHLKSFHQPDLSHLKQAEGNAQLIQTALREDPVVVGFQAQLLFGSRQSQENAQTSSAVLHQTQLLLDFCHTGRRVTDGPSAGGAAAGLGSDLASPGALWAAASGRC